MQTLHGANDTIVHLLQRLEVLMSGRQDDAELDDKPASQCDEELRALQSGQKALQSVQEALKRRMSLVSRKRNTFPPINTLPSELLVDIFAIAIDDDGPGSICSDHATLSLVCQHWNHLVDTTPSLWTSIHSEMMSMTKITRALEKSQNAPLDIKCTSWFFEPAKRSAFMNAIIPHAHRWREVILALMEADKTLKGIATLPMPLLESLDLSVDRSLGWVGEKPLDLFAGRPPPTKFRKLSLGGIPVPWSPTILCHLTTLRISRIDSYLGPSFDQLLAVLSACPDLESLSISDVDVSFSGGDSTSPSNPIHMPALATLELGMLTTEITNRLLACIHAPNCISGTLHCNVVGDPLQVLFTSDVSHFFDHVRSNPYVGTILCNPGGVTTSLMGPWYIRIRVENMTFAKNILVSLSPYSRIELVASGLYRGLMREDLAVAAGIEGVYRVAFGYGVPASGALTLLAICSSEQGGNRWSFPALEEMSIEGDISGDEFGNLLLMLRMRNGTQDDQHNAQYPKSLRKLELGSYTEADDPLIANFSSTYWPNHLDEVRRLLGPEGELIWYRRIVTKEGVLEDRIVSEGESY